MQTRYFLFALAVAAALTLSCKKDDSQTGNKPGRKGEPIAEVNGRIRFYVDLDENNAVTARLIPGKDLTGYSLFVNGKENTLVKDANGDFYAEVAAHYSKTYDAVLIDKDTRNWYGTSATDQIAVPYSQFCPTTEKGLKSYPRFCAYAKETGNLLTFGDNLAMLDLKVSGGGTLSSVKVRAVGGELIAGKASYTYSPKAFALSEGLDHAVVNCNGNGGLDLTAGGVSVPVFLAPGNYSQGLEITLCSKDHKMMRKTLPAFSLAAGEIRTENLLWAPAGDLLWYEGFDNFVWGGDIIGGEGCFGYAPDGITSTGGGWNARDGYAQAFTRVDYKTPGMGFVQSDTWLDVKDKTVATSHVVKNSYIESRNISDWDYMFRAQEYHGILAVGTAASSNRGIIQVAPCKSLKGMSDARVTFKMCFQNGATDDLLVQIINAGHITTVKVDGRAVPQEANYYLETASGTVDHNKVSIPSSLAEPKTWHNVELTVTGVTDETRLHLAGANSGSGVHGFYLDDIEVRAIAGTAKKGNLRLMYMNIQNGMWSDQGNNYDNFVAWVRKYEPDICVWCEAETVFAAGTDTYLSSSQRYLPDHWTELAARYGHSNYNGARRDEYPQAVTSRYKITRVQGIAGTSSLPVSHGAGHFQITVNGRTLNIVTCHLWPHKDESMKPAVYPTADEYREYEMQYIINQTVKNPTYASVQDWILVGDFNSSSRLDNGIYQYPTDDKRFLAQDVILNNTNLKDIIATWYPAPQFVRSTYRADRRDYVYLSPALVQNVVRASTFTDSFTPCTESGVSTFRTPSDHRPFIIDFNL